MGAALLRFPMICGRRILFLIRRFYREINGKGTGTNEKPDVSGMIFDTSLPREERIALFLQAVENPYCFCIGGIGVKIEFAESGPSLQDTLTDFLLRQKSGL